MTAPQFPDIADERSLWWLENPAQPRKVAALRLVRRGPRQPGGVSLEYDPQWLREGQALSEDLPLRAGEFLPAQDDSAAGAVDDARPDRWGERVIRLLDRPARLSTLEFLFYAGDDRFGALGVSASPDQYEPRRFGPMPTLADVQTIHDVVRRVEAGESVDELRRRLVTPGATLGGARPKALIELDGAQCVLKFSESGDPLDSPLVEHAAMTLAAHAGIEVSRTRAIPYVSGHALAVQRFDRDGSRRVHALSAHVALRAAGQEYGYPELALLLRRRAPAQLIKQQGEQVFRRMVFNILIDNTDDHEKNHVLLVDADQHYRLSPAFDVLPSGQALGYQQIRVGRDGADASIDNALSEHRAFALTLAQARAVSSQVARVVHGWRAHFEAQGVAGADVSLLSQQIDRPYLLEQREAAMRG
jgi:serine/threonine-protein kinase HipA